MSKFKQLDKSLKIVKGCRKYSSWFSVRGMPTLPSRNQRGSHWAPHKLIEHACPNKVDLLTHTPQAARVGGIYYLMLEATLVKLLNKCVAVRAKSNHWTSLMSMSVYNWGAWCSGTMLWYALHLLIMSWMVTDNNAKHFQDTGPPAHSITQLAASLPSAAQNKKCSFK